MSLRSRLALALFLPVTALLVAPAPAHADSRGPIAAPDGPGPYAVGRTTFVARDAARGRSLTVDAWYPVDPADAAGPSAIYDLIFTGIVSSRARTDAPPSADGPFPLVVFSHGNGGIRFQSYFLTEILASHGFVVVSPDHAGNTALDFLFGTNVPFLQAALDRPQDVSFLIDVLLARSANPDDPFAGRIDPRRIGVSGHSFGGYTSLAVTSGIPGVPADPRVRAIAPLAPASSSLTDAQLAGIRVPTLIVGGTLDTTTPIDPQSTRPFERVTARPRYRVDVVDAGHASFTNTCAIAEALGSIGLPQSFLDAVLRGLIEEGCAPELIPIQDAQQVTNRYVVAFFQRHLALDPRYKRYLTPGHARNDPDVIYFQVAGGGP